MSKKSDTKKSNKTNDKNAAASKPRVFVVKPKGAKPDFTPKSARITPEERIASAYNQSCTLLGKLADGVIGHYGIKNESGGIVIAEVRDHAGKPVIFITASTVQNVVPDGSRFLPVSTLRHEALAQVTDEKTFPWQVKVHAFLREHITSFCAVKTALCPDVANYATKVLNEAEVILEAEKKANRPLTEADKQAIESAAQRREEKMTKKWTAQKATQKEVMILAHMRKNSVPAINIAHGHLGYCDLGNLIVNFYVDGADRKVRVEYMGENHILRLAGIPLMYSVFASAVQTGEVDEVSRQMMTAEDYRKRSILAKHIQQQMEERGIRFKKKRAVSH